MKNNGLVNFAIIFFSSFIQKLKSNETASVLPTFESMFFFGQGSCNNLFVIFQDCCANTTCCQKVGNGFTALNCLNAGKNVPTISPEAICTGRTCTAGKECIRIFDIMNGHIVKKFQTKCCTNRDNGSFLCDNQVYCNSQAGNSGGNQQLCCTGSCNSASSGTKSADTVSDATPHQNIANEPPEPESKEAED